MSAVGRPAVFLDRDGTIIEDVGTVVSRKQVRLFPDTVAALTLLKERFELFVVTNQSGISRGEVMRDQVDTVNRSIGAALARNRIEITEWYVCPHDRSDGCHCIKPNPTFLERAAARYGIDLTSSFVIGDHPHDVATGSTTGTFGLYLLTGHGSRHLHELPLTVPVFHSLLDAARWAVAYPNGAGDLERSIEAGAEAVRTGGLVAFPTETVYGLGANALDEEAVAAVFRAKGRPAGDPLIVHVADRKQLGDVATSVSEVASRLIDEFWPGPLTLVLPKSPELPAAVSSGLSTVAVRMPANPWALELIDRAGVPVAAPSANVFGKTSPTTAAHVVEQLEGAYQVLIDGGACRVGVESTVLALSDQGAFILRPGGLSREAIEAVIGPVSVPSPRDESGASAGHHASPGMLDAHYAPRTPLEVVDDPSGAADDARAGIILFGAPSVTYRGVIRVLSPGRDLAEAAANLYRSIRELDASMVDRIVVERFPAHGIGVAMNDRITRASTKTAMPLESVGSTRKSGE